MDESNAEPDMFWDANDPEHFGGENLHDTLCDIVDCYCPDDFPATITLQCAKRLPDLQVRVTGRDEDDELQYEVVRDESRAAETKEKQP